MEARPTPQVPLDQPKDDTLPVKDRLRVLLIPQIGLKNIRGDSSYWTCHYLAKHNPTHFFYLTLPSACKGKEVPLPNVRHLFYDIPVEFLMVDLAVSMDMVKDFNRRMGRYVVDAVFAYRPTSAQQISTALSDFRRKDYVPVFLMDGGVWPFPMANVMENFTKGWSYAACHTVVRSDHDLNFVAEYVRYACSPAAVDMFYRRATIFPSSTEIERIDRINAETVKWDTPTVFIGCRFNESKNVRWITETMDMLYQTGKRFDMVCTTPTIEGKGMKFIHKEAMNWIKEMHWECPQEEYLRHAARCHIGIYAEIDSAFPLYMVEQMLLGVVPLIPSNRKWPFIVLPKDYPYQFSSREECLTLVSNILDGYEKAIGRIQPYIRQAREQFDSKKTNRAMMEKIAAVVNEDRMQVAFKQGPLLGAVEAAVRKLHKDRILQTELRRAINAELTGTSLSKVGDAEGRIPRTAMPSLHDIRDVMAQIGYEDTCKGAHMTFERRP